MIENLYFQKKNHFHLLQTQLLTFCFVFFFFFHFHFFKFIGIVVASLPPKQIFLTSLATVLYKAIKSVASR